MFPAGIMAAVLWASVVRESASRRGCYRSSYYQCHRPETRARYEIVRDNIETLDDAVVGTGLGRALSGVAAARGLLWRLEPELPGACR